MNYAVIGARGFLGSYLLELLETQGHRIFATARETDGLRDTDCITWLPCDVTDAQQVKKLVDKMSPFSDWNVLYLAACHHPDVVQKDPRMAWNTNITALSAFLNCLESIKSFYYPSTDTVYGEGTVEKRFSESDSLAPVNLYGKQKALAEQIVLTYGHHVIRYPFLIGSSHCPSRKHFYDVICDTVTAGKPMDMFSDSYRSALSFRQAAQYLIDLTQFSGKPVPHLLNVASDDALSKYEIGRRIAKLHGVDLALIRPITIHRAAGIFEAPRASTTLMDNTQLKNLLGVSSIHLHLDGERSPVE